MQRQVFCAETIIGLENIFIQELKKVISDKVQIIKQNEGLVFFSSNFNLKKFLDLKTATGIYISLNLKGNLSRKDNIDLINSAVKQVILQNQNYFNKNVFKTLKFSIKNTSDNELKDLKTYLVNQNNLNLVQDDGDLLIKKLDKFSYVLVRITSRPLAVRNWRSSNFKAALNSTIANAMITLTEPKNIDNVLNICAGSGTLLIERCLMYPLPNSALGYEINDDTLKIARINIKKAKLKNDFKIEYGDCTNLLNLVNEKKFNVVVGDLPFGMSVGNKADNQVLYYRLLTSVQKVIEPQSRICLITQDTKNLNLVLDQLKDQFKILKEIKLSILTKRNEYINPVIYLLKNV